MKTPIRILFVLLGMAAMIQLAAAQGIRNSKHDLSLSSTTTGPKSTTLDQVCVFCHTPHSTGSTTLLWNRDDPTSTFTPYSSATMEQTIGQPASVSKNCLSCHDGVTGFNQLVNNPGSGLGTDPTVSPATMGTGIDSLGIDLTNDHPVSFDYSSHQATDSDLRVESGTAGKYYVTDATNNIPLYGSTGTLECGSCHDPHDNVNGTFLRISNSQSTLCFVCHTK